MTKFLVAITGLVSLSTAVTPLFNQQNNTPTQQKADKKITFNEAKRTQVPKFNEWIYVEIEDLNLTVAGIRSINQLNSEYSKITLPGLNVKFDNNVMKQNDSFGVRKAEKGNQNWDIIKQSKIDNVTTFQLERQVKIDTNDDGDLIMNLIYKCSPLANMATRYLNDGQVDFTTGDSIIIS